MTITAEMHDGTRLEFPDGTDPAVIQSTVQNVLKQRQSTSEKAGSTLRDIPRQVGLTARYGIEGLGNLVNVVTEPVRNAMKMAGIPADQSTGELATSLADRLALPSPQGANERVVGDAARAVAGAGGMIGGAARFAAARAPGLVKDTAALLAARPGIQAAGAAGAGLAGGSVREAGGGPIEQFGAALAGGLAGGAAVGTASNALGAASRGIKAMMGPRPADLVNADQQINLVLQRSSVDWTQVPERIRQSMRQEVAQALNTGQPLNPDAIRRLLVFRRTETTPTVGQLTQDPGMITRERNLAKTAANSTDPSLQTLPMLENNNFSKLLGGLDELGARAAPRAPEAATMAVNGLTGVANARRGAIDALYQSARDSEGRSVILDGRSAAQQAIRRLEQDGVGKLPPEVDRWLNELSLGQRPLTVDYQQKLVKNLYRKMNGTADGDVRHGLRIIREALDNADVPQAPAQTVTNPGNLPAVRSSVPAMPGMMRGNPPQAGQEAIDAFRAARSANRAYMQTLEANPALAAVDDAIGAVSANPQLRNVPDAVGTGTFTERFLTSKTVTPGQAQGLAENVGPEGRQALRQYLASYLRGAATNNTGDITKFSNDAYRKAFESVRDKLPAFFNSEEIQQLRNIGDAAKYIQAQPAGSAVNNSNSGALLLGRGGDMLNAVAERVPFGLKDTLSGTVQGLQQRQVLNARNALMLPFVRNQQPVPVNPLLAGSVLGTEQPRKNDRRD